MALELIGRDKRNPLEPADEAHVLRRLLEEELLVQRGVELGLVESDRAVRKAIVAAMIDSIVAESAGKVASDDELRAFYDENRDYFTGAPLLRVRQAVFRNGAGRGDTQGRAQHAHAAIVSGMSVVRARVELADEPVLTVPDELLPASALREYIGPTALRTLLSMQPGEVTQPLRVAGGYQILELVAREDARPPAFETVREEVEQAYVRQAGDEALREYLDWLRAEAHITVAPGAPAMTPPGAGAADRTK
jgi:hypothetical protein